MEKLNEVKINNTVRTYISTEDFTRIKNTLDEREDIKWTKTEVGKKGSEYILELEVDDMYGRIRQKLENMSVDELRIYATHQVYIREGQDANRNQMKAELGLGSVTLTKGVKDVVSAYIRKGYSIEQIMDGTAKKTEDEKAELAELEEEELATL